MKKWLEKMDWIYVIVPLALLGTFWVIAAFTGQWPWQSNPYNSYALQTDSWLKGRLDLGQDYPWLELAIYQGKYFVSFPPFPSLFFTSAYIQTPIMVIKIGAISQNAIPSDEKNESAPPFPPAAGRRR
jgi:hypothetical protein